MILVELKIRYACKVVLMRCQEIDRLQFLDSISGIVIIRIFECTETNLRFLLEEIIILVGTLYMCKRKHSQKRFDRYFSSILP